jgi:serine/threonine protein kinase
MHSAQICHRDLKLENILVTDKGKIKLIDFGFSISTCKDQMLQVTCGTTAYMSPELVSKKEY